MTMPMPNQLEPTLARHAVTVYSRHVESTAVLLRDEHLDGAGQTISVLGCKSCIPGRSSGEKIAVRLPNGVLVPALITHIHKLHDRFRAVIDTRRLAAAGFNDVPSLQLNASPQAGTVKFIDALQV